MKRIAFSILYNSNHHLKHNGFAENMLKMFDHWIIVEGAAGNKGSTSWCNDVRRSHKSEDGTREYISKLQVDNPDKVSVAEFRESAWQSKDEMCKAAIHIIHSIGVHSCFLWQVDADEQWTSDQLCRSEKVLTDQEAKTGMFFCDCFLSSDLVAIGDWGEGRSLPYRRLWNWNGEDFDTHEPPIIVGGNKKEIHINERFQHYSYYFEKDVYFKSLYYGGHQNIYDKWLILQDQEAKKNISFPIPLSFLFGRDTWAGRSNTFITKIKQT